MKFYSQFTAVFEAEFKSYVREMGPLLFMSAFPFIFSVLTYSFGSVISGAPASIETWFFQLIGFSVMVVSLVLTGSSAWYFKRGVMTGRLEYLMAAPVNPVTAVMASSLANVLIGLISFIVVGSVGTATVYGFARLLNFAAALLIVYFALLPVVGLALVIGVLTIILKEAEPVIGMAGSIISATAGFVYPITMLPAALQLIGKALPFHHVVETARAIILNNFSIMNIVNLMPLTLYLAAGLAVYRLGERYYARKVGVH